MKTEHRNNLLKLAAYVEDKVDDDQFDMKYYWNHCGAHGCFLGHAIHAGIVPSHDLPVYGKFRGVLIKPNDYNHAYDYDTLAPSYLVCRLNITPSCGTSYFLMAGV